MLFGEKIKHISRLSFLLLFVSYLGGLTLFTHTHVVNGVIIVHSHPGKAGHIHTTGQIETVFFLSHFLTSGEVVSSCPLSLYLSLCFSLLIPSLPRQIHDGNSKIIRLRAPPSGLSIQ